MFCVEVIKPLTSISVEISVDVDIDYCQAFPLPRTRMIPSGGDLFDWSSSNIIERLTRAAVCASAPPFDLCGRHCAGWLGE